MKAAGSLPANCGLVVVPTLVRLHPPAPMTAQAVGAAATTVRALAFAVQAINDAGRGEQYNESQSAKDAIQLKLFR